MEILRNYSDWQKKRKEKKDLNYQKKRTCGDDAHMLLHWIWG